MTRQDIIRDYIGRHGPDIEMLEIGVDYGDTWHHQRGVISNYTGVDISLARVTVPMDDPRSHWFEMDSREFWKAIQAEQLNYVHGGWNLIYVDGCHDYEIVLIDVRESLRWLLPGGFLLVHDVDVKENGPYRAFAEICLADQHGLSAYVDERHRWGMGVCRKEKE